MPSDAVFSDIASGKIDATGFDLETAQKMYGHMADAPANLQTAEWNKLLQKSRISEMGNVIEAERLQLMTRDITCSELLKKLCLQQPTRKPPERGHDVLRRAVFLLNTS